MSKRIAIYVQGESIPRAMQEAACREWAQANGYTVAFVRHDVAPSRPSLEQLIAEIPDEKFEAILAYKTSSYSRNTELVQKLVRAARAAHIKVLTADDWDLTDTGTLFMTQVEALHHTYQRDKEREELRVLHRRGFRRVVADLTDEDWKALSGFLGSSVDPLVMNAWQKLQEGVQDPEDPGRG